MKEKELLKIKQKLHLKLAEQIASYQIANKLNLKYEKSNITKLLYKLECINIELNNISGILNTIKVDVNSLELN